MERRALISAFINIRRIEYKFASDKKITYESGSNDMNSPQEPVISPQHGILSLTIKDLSVLYAAYMPFVENGGLFIPTSKVYQIGDEVFMLLHLMEEEEQIPVAGTVIWITPKNAHGKRAPGIGVQFNNKDNPAKPLIGEYLAGELGSGKPTHTM